MLNCQITTKFLNQESKNLTGNISDFNQELRKLDLEKKNQLPSIKRCVSDFIEISCDNLNNTKHKLFIKIYFASLEKGIRLDKMEFDHVCLLKENEQFYNTPEILFSNLDNAEFLLLNQIEVFLKANPLAFISSVNFNTVNLSEDEISQLKKKSKERMEAFKNSK